MCVCVIYLRFRFSDCAFGFDRATTREHQHGGPGSYPTLPAIKSNAAQLLGEMHPGPLTMDQTTPANGQREDAKLHDLEHCQSSHNGQGWGWQEVTTKQYKLDR